MAADITVYGTMAVSPLLDLIDAGANRALAEDLVVYAETIAIDTALQNAVNFAVALLRGPPLRRSTPSSSTLARLPVLLRRPRVDGLFDDVSLASVTL